MKCKIVYLLLPLFLLSCSKKPSEISPQPQNEPSAPANALPFAVAIVETPEAGEIDAIMHQAAALLDSKDYGGLDDMAGKYRASKECYADCSQKLALVYDGLEPSDGASNVVWEARLQELRNWIKVKPESATARVALARCLVSYAWKARGGDYASKVSDESWQTFFKRLNEAVEVLNGTKNLTEQCPAYWSTLMRAALGLQITKAQFDNIFQQAIKAVPYYKYYYHVRAVFLLPRWYGEEGEWQKDLARSADSLGGEEGDMVYAQVVWGIHHYGQSIDVFEGNYISWGRVDSGFAVILKQFPDSLAAKNERAYLASLAGDREKARDYFARTEGKVDLSVWDSQDEFVKYASWAYGK